MYFHKYQGTGNDFIMLDSYHSNIELSSSEIKKLCNRNFGIGADGLILIKRNPDFDFEMDYYNSDGSSATFCGNGARCIVAFAKMLHIIDEEACFIAKDGVHEAKINNDIVKLQLKNVETHEQIGDDYNINTGTEHYVKFCEELDKYKIINEAQKIRYSKKFQPKGTNVNFAEFIDNKLNIRTYEKGVEDETLSCGTGVVASALCYAIKKKASKTSHETNIKTKGGDLKVFFTYKNNVFTDIWLQGKASLVFAGEIYLY